MKLHSTGRESNNISVEVELCILFTNDSALFMLRERGMSFKWKSYRNKLKKEHTLIHLFQQNQMNLSGFLFSNVLVRLYCTK